MALGLTMAAAIAAMAAPPPVGVPIALVSADEDARMLGEVYVGLLRQRGYFAERPLPIGQAELRACKDAACLRGLAAGKETMVAVLVTPVTAESHRWQCVGVAESPKFAHRQDVTIDMRLGLFGTPEQKLAARSAAAGCIMAAGAESGW